MTTAHLRRTALALLCVAACGPRDPEPPADTAVASRAAATRPGTFAVTAEQRTRLHVVTVQPTTYRRVVQTTGTVAFNGDRSTQVLSPISGPATRILVNPGSVVPQGAPLALVASPDFATAEADYRKAESAYRNQKRITDLDEQLWKNDAIARNDLEQARTDLAAAGADRDAAIQQLKALGVTSAQLSAIATGRDAAPLQATIRAPIAGTVVEKLITPGQLLQAGATPCFTIADLSSMWVMASVFTGDVRNVAVGESVDVYTDASPTPITGRVDYVAALVDPGSKAVSVRVVVPNVGRALRRDMFVRVGIHAARPTTGIVIPASAVLRDENNLPFVYVAGPSGAFDRRQITLGSQIGETYEVSAGLEAGDQIVTEGALFVQFGASQ